MKVAITAFFAVLLSVMFSFILCLKLFSTQYSLLYLMSFLLDRSSVLS